MARPLLAALVVAAALHPAMARADGALAIGLPADVARDGIAFGWAVRLPLAEAERVALAQCRGLSDVSEETRALCRVVRSFAGACVAVALDPDEGTPGFGWAIAPSKGDAEAQALGDCRRSAGETRQAYCAILVSDCDVRR